MTAPTPAKVTSSTSRKPLVIPSRCGSVRRRPKRAPELSSIRLLGPGVIDMTNMKIRSGGALWSRADAAMTVMIQQTDGDRHEHQEHCRHHRHHARHRSGDEPGARPGRLYRRDAVPKPAIGGPAAR